MPRQPELKISMVSVTVLIELPPGRRLRRDDADAYMSLELWADVCRVWDGIDRTLCGETYSYTKRTDSLTGRGYDQLPDIPYFDQVYRYLVDQHASNRGNPLGKFVGGMVESMERAVCERSGSRVYFAQVGSRIKIGWSRNVAARVATLQTANADRIRLLATTPGARSLERQLHERFAAARVSGEWFEMTPELVTYIESLQVNG